MKHISSSLSKHITPGEPFPALSFMHYQHTLTLSLTINFFFTFSDFPLERDSSIFQRTLSARSPGFYLSRGSAGPLFRQEKVAWSCSWGGRVLPGAPLELPSVSTEDQGFRNTSSILSAEPLHIRHWTPLSLPKGPDTDPNYRCFGERLRVKELK